jgi:hypothetical protein
MPGGTETGEAAQGAGGQTSGVKRRRASLTNAEREGLSKALVVVRENAASYKQSGLSPLSFWIGLMNVAFSAFLLGRAPEWYWVWQVRFDAKAQQHSSESSAFAHAAQQ